MKYIDFWVQSSGRQGQEMCIFIRTSSLVLKLMVLSTYLEKRCPYGLAVQLLILDAL